MFLFVYLSLCVCTCICKYHIYIYVYVIKLNALAIWGSFCAVFIAELVQASTCSMPATSVGTRGVEAVGHVASKTACCLQHLLQVSLWEPEASSSRYLDLQSAQHNGPQTFLVIKAMIVATLDRHPTSMEA